MCAKKKTREEQQPVISTEHKIIAAAKTVFTKKGYSATRTRDIAAEAGINLALLNYYFRSKEKLFELIMFESASRFFLSIKSILNDTSTLVLASDNCFCEATSPLTRFCILA